jgi:hypothetical protein
MLKYLGGLGIWRMKKACLMRLDWSLRNGGSALWIDVLKGKYCRGHPNLDVVSAKRHDSSFWKALVSMWEEFNLFEF